MFRLFKRRSGNNVEFSQDVASIELGKHDKKPPREVPYFKIIVTILAFLIVGLILTLGIFLLLAQNKYLEEKKDAKAAIEARIKNYSKPLPNFCGEDVKMCSSGIVVEKSDLKCEFDTCPEFASDMTKFWDVKTSDEKYIRTYRNLDLNYEFSLVKTWDFVGKDYGFILYSPNYECGKEVETASGSVCDGTIIEMLSSNTTAHTDIEAWYNSDENHLLLNSENPPPTNIKITNVDGLKTLVTEDAINTLTYYFIFENNVYILRISSAGEVDYNLALPHIEKLLETFKFLQT